MKSALLLIVCLFVGITFVHAETIRVGAYENPPKVFSAGDGQIDGFFPAILAEVAKEQGWEIDYVPGAWGEELSWLESGEIDLMCDMAVSDSRKERFLFSQEPVVTSWAAVYARSGLSIQTLLDLKGKTVAVMAGSIHSDGIKAVTKSFDEPCRFVEVSTYREVLMLLDAKKVDVGVVNRLFGTHHADQFDLSVTPIVFNPCNLQFAVRKNSEKGRLLIEKIDSSLRRLKQDPASAYHKALSFYINGNDWEQVASEKMGLPRIKLSPDELVWVKAHPRIRIGMDPGFAPFECVSKDGQFTGMAADYLELLSQKTGLEFELVEHSSWSKSVEALKEGTIDLLPCVGISEARRVFMNFSKPYLKFSRVIVTRKDSKIEGMKDLSDCRVGVQSHSSHAAFLQQNSTVNPQLYSSFQEAILAVSRGEVDATIGNLAVTSHVMRELSITNLKLAAYATNEPQSLSIGVRKDWPELRAILNRALGTVSLKQRSAILEKWLPLPRATKSGLGFTCEEREWLLMHPRIRVAWDRNWAPIEFAGSQGEMAGITTEYLHAIEDALGIEFEMDESPNWQESYGKLTKHELDMSSCLAITPQRLTRLDFTDTYLSGPVVIFGRDEMPYIRDLSELTTLKVGVVDDYGTDHWLSRDFPEVPLVRVKNLAEGFQWLSQGKLDVFVANVINGNYHLSTQRRQRLNNIKIIGETPYSYKLRMAVRKDWPLFTGILNKALASLSDVDQTAFYRKWVWVKYEHGFDYSLFGKIIAVAVVIVLLFVWWNRRLVAEIRQRRKAEALLCASEKSLLDSNDHLKKLERQKDDLTHMIVHDMRSPLTTISGALDLLAMDVPDMNDAGRANMNLVKLGAMMLHRMVQALLDVMKLESQAMSLALKSVDLKTVVDRSVQLMQPRAKQAGIQVYASGESSFNLVDSELVVRMVTNLVENAIRASVAGTSVEVFVGSNQIEVRDSGKGISASDRKRIFDKFGRLETKGKVNHSSVGLGLTFCKLAAEAHGGLLELDSEVGRGSVFRIVFKEAYESVNAELTSDVS